MFVQLSCVVVDAEPGNRQEMMNFLASNGLNVNAALSSIEELSVQLQQSEAPRVALVNLDPNPQETLRKVEPLIRQYPHLHFFVMSSVVEASLLMDAMHAGVKEFVPLPVNQEKLLASLERIVQVDGLDKRSKIIHMIPTIGGCGSTTVCCNVAAALAKNHKVLIIDLDLVRGAVANAFDLRPRYTIADLMDPTTKLDKALLENALSIHRNTGLAVLSRPELPEDARRVNYQGMTRLLGAVGRMFDYVLIDSVMSADSLYSAALRAADVNVLVMQLNIPSAKNTERFLGAMRRMGVDPNTVKVVVNRFAKKGYDIGPDEVERALGLKISWTIPNDYKSAISAINYGEPVVLRSPRAEMSGSIQGLMHMLNGRDSRN